MVRSGIAGEFPLHRGKGRVVEICRRSNLRRTVDRLPIYKDLERREVRSRHASGISPIVEIDADAGVVGDRRCSGNQRISGGATEVHANHARRNVCDTSV